MLQCGNLEGPLAAAESRTHFVRLAFPNADIHYTDSDAFVLPELVRSWLDEMAIPGGPRPTKD